MPSIANIPDELWLQIFTNLEGDCKSLSNLCLTSRKLRGPAEDVLYRSIVLPLRKHSSIYRLIVTLCKRPTLARKVQALRMHILALDQLVRDPYFSAWIERVSAKPLAIKEYQPNDFINDCAALITTSKDTQLSSHAAWKVEILKKGHASFGGLLLSLLPSLLHFEVKVYDNHRRESELTEVPLLALFSIPDRPSPSAIRSLDPMLHSLKHVTRLRLSMYQQSLLDLPFPSLVVLELDINRRGVEFRATYPSLRTLVIRNGGNQTTEEQNQAFVTVKDEFSTTFDNLGCFNLISFEYLMGYGDRTHVVESQYCSDVITHLARVSGTLQALRIDIVGAREDNVYKVEHFDKILVDITGLRTLCHFDSLRKLEVIQHALIPRSYNRKRYKKPNLTNILPPFLEVLTIYCPDRKVLQWLEDLFAVIDSFNLKRINLRCRSLWGKSAVWFKERRPKVFEEFRRREVIVHVTQEEVTVERVIYRTRPKVDTTIWMEEEGWQQPSFNVES